MQISNASYEKVKKPTYSNPQPKLVLRGNDKPWIDSGKCQGQ